MTIRFVPPKSPITKVDSGVLDIICSAQTQAVEQAFATAANICTEACVRAGIASSMAHTLENEPLLPFVDRAHGEIVAQLLPAATKMDISRSGIVCLVDNIQLLRAFASPSSVIEMVRKKVDQIVDGFPRAAIDLERGRNPGDVLDPFLLSATQYLLCDGDIEEGIRATVSHKCMMMVENLVGNLHQDVIGAMRGNVRLPEPRGEELDPKKNPFPGADVLQVPLAKGEPLRFFQLKSKTGSAKGGDGIRLGRQLQALIDQYGGEAWYAAIVGNTLDGHRSIAGVRTGCPDVIVTVGNATLRQVTRSPIGGELLLRVYQSAFRDVARAHGYTAKQVANAISADFRQRLQVGDDELLDGILRHVTGGPAEQQDSRVYRSPRLRRAVADVSPEKEPEKSRGRKRERT